MINKLFDQLELQPHFKRVALVVKLFRQAVRNTDEEDDKDSKYEKYFKDPEDYSRVIQYCFLRLPAIIKQLYNVDYVCTLSKSDIESHIQQMVVRAFLLQALKFLENLVNTQEHDEKTMLYVVQALGNLNTIFTAFDNLLKRSLKLLLTIWSGHPSLKIKLHAFVQVRRVFPTLPEHQQITILKKFYLKFCDGARHIIWRNYEGVNFMVNCVVEILNLNMNQAYQVAYESLQTLVKKVRELSEKKNEENVKGIFNQQTISILKLWTSAICTHHRHNQLGDLMPAMIQIILAVMDFYPSVEHYTFQLHLSRLVIQLSSTFKVQTNLLPYLLRMLGCAELKRRKLKSSAKAYDFEIGFQIKQKHRQSSQFWGEFCQQTIGQIVLYLNTLSRREYFYEYTIFLVKELKRIIKSFEFDGYKMMVKKLIRMIEQQGQGEGESALETEAQRLIYDRQEQIKQRVISEKERIEAGGEEEEIVSDMEQDIIDQKDQEYVYDEIRKYKDQEKADQDEEMDYGELDDYEGDPNMDSD